MWYCHGPFKTKITQALRDYIGISRPDEKG
jgi:hypothetical protein